MASTRKRTILLYGRTGSGKTAQLGRLAEHVKQTSGKKTRVYLADKAGIDTIEELVEAGLMEVVEIGSTNPFVFLHKAVRGYVRTDKGQWILDDHSKIGMFAFEGLRSFAEELRHHMIEMAAQGVSIGGGGQVAFSVHSDGETLKVGGSNMVHYGVAQDRIVAELWQSLKLPADYILWTSTPSKDEDNLSTTKVVGPDVIGRALTGEVPRWFKYTFRIDVEAGRGGQPEKHPLYLGTHIDLAAGGAMALGNTRLPLGAKLAQTVIEPADLVKAFEIIDAAKAKAAVELKLRLGSDAVGVK